MSYSISTKVGKNFVLGHVPELRRKNGAPGRVTTLVERNSHLFSTESCDFEESFRVNSGIGLQDKSAICRCLDPHLGSRATDSGDLFLRPKNVDFSEGDTVITGFHHQIGARGR